MLTIYERSDCDGHVMRREDENSMKRIMTAEVNGRRSRGRQMKRRGDIVQQDMKSLRLKIEHIGDRKTPPL